MKFRLNEATEAEFREILRLGKEIGIENISFLDRFSKEMNEVEGDTLLDKLRNYSELIKTDLEEDMHDVRHITNMLLDMMDNHALDAKTLAIACLKYMSEDDVADMAHLNGFTDKIEFDDNFDLDEAFWADHLHNRD